MEEFKELDQIFRKGLENAKVNPPAGVWESISASVSTGAVATAKTAIWVVAAKWVAGALVAGGIAYGGMLALQDEKPVVSDKTEQTIVTNSGEEVGPETPEAVKTETRPENKVSSNEPRNVQDLMMEEEAPIEPIGPILDMTHDNGEGWAYPPLSALDKQPRNTNSSDKPMNQYPGVGNVENGAGNCKNQMVIAVKQIAEAKYTFTATPSGEDMIWHFDDGTVARGVSVTHQYSKEAGVYYARVNANIKGCRDSAIHQITIRGAKPVLPDVFTPNSTGHAENDSLNNVYVVEMKNTTYFDLVVRDLQGRQLFRSDNPSVKWNGKCANIECPEGTYQVTLAYKYPGDEKPTVIVQRVLLIREKR